MSDKRVLVVKVKTAGYTEDLVAMRDYVIESLHKGVLVLDASVTYSVEEFPEVGGTFPVVVSLREGRDELPPSDKEEKQAILARLQAYREQNGVGCLSDVAKKTKDKTVTPDFLRLLLVGDVTASLTVWRRIGAALRTLESIPSETEAAE